MQRSTVAREASGMFGNLERSGSLRQKAESMLERAGSFVQGGLQRMGTFGRSGRRASTPGLVRRCSIGDITQVNQYKIEKMIGVGSHGTVFLAEDEDTGQNFAIKAVTHHLTKRKSRSVWTRGPGVTDQKADSYDPEMMLDREIAIMKKLDHPNVLKLFEVIEDQASREVFLVLEYLTEGSVMPDEEDCPPLEIDVAWHYFRQLISAIHYCHNNGVIHCDIKPSNLLLKAGDIKVSDFGTSRLMGSKIGPNGQCGSSVFSFDDQVSRVMGTTAFLSPQAHMGQAFSGKCHDVWSAGVTLFFFVYGHSPFQGEGIMDMHENVKSEPLTFPDSPEIPESLKDLLSRTMEKSEADRISTHEIMEHEWVTKGGTEPIPTTQNEPLEVTIAECEQAVGKLTVTT